MLRTTSFSFSLSFSLQTAGHDETGTATSAPESATAIFRSRSLILFAQVWPDPRSHS
jgi:hypothetical protein